MKSKLVGKIEKRVIDVLSLDVKENTPIYIGETNYIHIQSKHPDDYKKYGEYIDIIIKEPDYVGINPKDQSLEYVKSFIVENEYVKVAIRVSAKQKHYVRSLYVLKNSRVLNFIEKGFLHPV